MITLENEQLRVLISPEGAELVSVLDKASNHEFLWQADPTHWPRRAPVLFPIIGGLKEQQFTYKGQAYQPRKHGFARDKVFQVQATTDNSATFYLKNDAETMQEYPFEFSFQITYILHQNKITISYEVLNPSTSEPLYYSVGGHPGFNVTMNEAGEFSQVQVGLEPEGLYLRIPITADGLADFKKAKYQSVGMDTVCHKDFKKDAIVYQINDKTEAILRDKKSKVEIRLRPSRMEYLGIWTPYATKAPFICLEPWAGITDKVETSGLLEEKQGIHHLPPNQLMTHDYTITFTKH
ncbi:MAG: aldose 1-epimerase family protein [Aerococcaceae bacterium]|nr:aldose 1-epimerase family protein [Aerococcaceae bacterium]